MCVGLESTDGYQVAIIVEVHSEKLEWIVVTGVQQAIDMLFHGIEILVEVSDDKVVSGKSCFLQLSSRVIGRLFMSL